MGVLQIHGGEQSILDPALSDGGLPPAPGVHSFQIFRASSDVPEQSDKLGWTYHHHVDMACWKGRLYVGWNSCQRDEDVWPSRELYSSSADGSAWSEPAELFPQGVSTCLRMYFFCASNDRMLAIAGLRTDHEETREDRKNALVVREIRHDHSLREVFTLQALESLKLPAPRFDTSGDEAFKQACRELLADHMYLEQQDRGRLLGSRRMKWHDAAAWPGGAVPGENEKWVCGKAFSFFRRPDKTWVGISKMGWVTSSIDDGQTWSQPEIPESLVTGKAKVWSQRTRDGRYFLAYNPSKSNRYPLVAVTSSDGVNFGDMRVIQGELPVQRYAGLHRSIGPQYVRGISHWADDGSREEDAVWLAYSINKEDIWVSRIPVPIRSDETAPVEDDFSRFAPGPFVPGWNIYRPKWSSAQVAKGALRLSNSDPYDYAQATRVFPESARIAASFDLQIDRMDGDLLEIDLLSKYGSRRLVRLSIGEGGNISPSLLKHELARFQIDADSNRGLFSVSIDGRTILSDVAFAESPAPLHRISFRTGAWRGIGGAMPVGPGTDRPCRGFSFGISKLTVAAAETG